MNKNDILMALQEKKINPEQAKLLLHDIQTYKINDHVDIKNGASLYDKDSIAIIGMSGRYPQVEDMREFWSVLESGKDCVEEIPNSRWNIDEYFDPEQGNNKMYSKSMGMIRDVKCFDPLFFEIPPSEAEYMDPLHRILIEEIYKATEDAGYTKEKLEDINCGLYAGMITGEYAQLFAEYGNSYTNITGNSNAIAAARISYYLNLKGPAVAIDTACSSSMVCTYMAIQALLNNEIDMAISAGSSVYISPHSYIAMCSAGMLSKDGKCKAFDNSANGFVPAEGAGALILKRLDDAIRDRDFINGVIIGAGINQDGRTNGITAPSLNRQIELVKDIHNKRNIDPETISYAELHGTGTKLGDPVELEALNTAFSDKTNKLNFCSIGSVKSNFGHTSAVAGICGIQKVILCMQHEKLVPTLHVKDPNEHFDFENSHFIINQETKEWKNNGMPRRACVSSFGFSGTNAHVILQEYGYPKVNANSNEINEEYPALFVLSAKTKEQLSNYAIKMQGFLKNNLDISLKDFLYTLQVGRTPMKERLAIIVISYDDLIQKLDAFLKYGSDEKSIFYACLKKKELRYESLQDSSLVDVLKFSVNEIAARWLENKKIDWEKLYITEKPQRISIPTIPLKREVFWLEKKVKDERQPLKTNNKVKSYPLIQNNKTDKFRREYYSTFNGMEFFIDEHKLNGIKVLAGSAILELAIQAGESALNSLVTDLNNIIWIKPITVTDSNVSVEIIIQAENQTNASFEVINNNEVCAKGNIVCGDSYSYNNKIIDIYEKIRSYQNIDCTNLYKNKAGVEYGKHFQAIKRLFFNKFEGIAEIQLRDSSINIEKELDEFTLHPGLLDGIMQTIIPLVSSKNISNCTYLPFSIGSIKVFDNLKSNMYVVTTSSDRINVKGMLSFNIQVTDVDGNIILAIVNYVVKELLEGNKNVTCSKDNQMVMYHLNWVNEGINYQEDDNGLLLIVDEQSDLVHELNKKYHRTIAIQPDTEFTRISENEYKVNTHNRDECEKLLRDIQERYPNLTLRIVFNRVNDVEMTFAFIQALMSLQSKQSIKIEYLYDIEDNKVLLENRALAGFFKTAMLEKKLLLIKNIGLSFIDLSKEKITEIVRDEFYSDYEQCEILYQEDKRYVNNVFQLNTKNENSSIIDLKNEGVYIIVGGAKGIGYIFAKAMCSNASINLIIVGRTEENQDIKNKLKELNDSDSTVTYMKADVSDKKAVEQLVNDIKQSHSEINGVIHSAGILRDALIYNKSFEDFCNVTASKIEGTKNLDEVLENEKLDFFVLFSSLSAQLGNVGQSDYCYGNSYMDNYAKYRNELQEKGLRHGKSLSINWPYLKDGGMHISENKIYQMKENYGMVPLESSDCINCFIEGLKHSASQVICTFGDKSKIDKLLKRHTDVTNTGVLERQVSQNLLNQEMEVYIKKIFSEIIKVREDRIDSTESFSSYGLDSIIIMNITRRLEKDFGELSKTLFFEHDSIDGIVEYFVNNHKERLEALFNIESIKEVTVDDSHSDNKIIQLNRENHVSEDDIAIIGISGRYPMAQNLGEFWQNLKDGKDCITEIPKERWNHEDYYDSREGVIGKSYSKWGGFLHDIDKFDPLFFNMSPKQADFLDPQARIFLENVWGTLEDAGYTRLTLKKNKVGVFVGVMYNMYELFKGEIKGNIVPVSASYSEIANRVSYFMDFNGPSIAVDTMCSSSLTALHLACESIRSGESDYAIAGGVNLSIHPNKYLLLSQSKFLSTDGRCKAFGKDGSGYVPGEGVGSLFLKPLSKAIDDNDNIYAVVKGSSVNTCGKTNSFTVPSPIVQAQLIKEAMDSAKITPEQITYIEAHGTGTSLGDPIEIKGLTKAFGEDSKRKPFCSIGSVKSNVGHLESAAGIVALSKVVLQLKNKTLVKSLHSDTLNPYIKFHETPFYVQHELEKWENHGEPLIAGISGFGAGGSNAHIILGGYEEQDITVVESTGEERLYILSAKDKERLIERVLQLCEFLKGETVFHISEYLNYKEESIAYTLQTGREEMPERLAIVASSISDLISKLENYTSQTLDSDIYTGNILDDKNDKIIVSELEDEKKRMAEYFTSKRYKKIAQLWVKGMKFNWDILYSDHKPKKIALPTYLFSKERCWVLTVDEMKSRQEDSTGKNLHPVIHTNVSTLNKVQFFTRFTGEEFFIKAHIILGQNVLPGAVYLEMVYEAARNVLADENIQIQIGNVIWLQPLIILDEYRELYTSLTPEKNGNLAFKIYDTNAKSEVNVYCEGVVIVKEFAEPKSLDIQGLKNDCQNEIEGSYVYEQLGSIGVNYGDELRSIKKVYIGKDEALVELVSSDKVAHNYNDYTLHPSILDAAFQSNISINSDINIDANEDKEVALPFALDKLVAYQSCTNHMFVHIKKVNKQGTQGLNKINIDICDENGNVCISLTHMTYKKKKSTSESEKKDINLFQHEWVESNVAKLYENNYAKSILILCNIDKNVADVIKNGNKFSTVILLEKDSGSVENKYASYAKQLFLIAKELISKRVNGKICLQFYVNIEGEALVYKGLIGVLKTLSTENCNIITQTVLVEGFYSNSELEAQLVESRSNTEEKVICYMNGKRYIQKIAELVCSNVWKQTAVWKDKGIYIITGGSGQLGVLVAREIAAKTKNSTIILIGRSKINERISTIVKGISENGVKTKYEQVDITDFKSTDQFIKDVLKEQGNITGVIHCAGIIKDNFIINKEESTFDEILAPKIYGVSNLDKAIGNSPIELFILFSSMASVIGNVGQVDYACGNGFLDAFAEYRNKLVALNQRFGHTLSLNWPLWEHGGMHVDESSTKYIAETTGLEPITTVNGMKLLQQAINSERTQLIPVEGNGVKIREFLTSIQNAQYDQNEINQNDTNQEDINTAIDEKRVLADLVLKLKNVLSLETKLDVSRISEKISLENYGIDSVMILHLTYELEKEYGTLPKTLFFDNQNLNELAHHLYSEYYEQTLKILGYDALCNKEDYEEEKVNNQDVRQEDELANEDMEIAIIGVAGKYPKATDIDEYWNNLKNGIDCITEVPYSRWNQAIYYDPDKSNPNKTYAKWGGFIDGIDKFDAAFFRISPVEAELIDPQERLFLECVYHAIEDSGYTRNSLAVKRGDVGVFVGVMNNEYQLYGAQSQVNGHNIALNGYTSSVANRTSYYFSFNGPSMSVDTMCSSSLVSVHLACNSIKNGECNIAIAGGVSLITHPNKFITLGMGRFASTSGRCRSFGKDGDGYTPGEGVGAIILKKKSQAINDGDHIYGVIRATAINHGGKTNGYTVPNPDAQEKVIKKALQSANINPREISYIEAHGTGTALGDPIEITALTRAFVSETMEKQFCKIGSAKSVIGHCESAAGIAGITKVLLQMKHKKYVKSLHSDVMNPYIDFTESPFVVSREFEDWKRPKLVVNGMLKECPRIAGVSGFGAGGTNAHIILEEYIEKDTTNWLKMGNKNHIIALSAKKDEQLSQQVKNLYSWIIENEESELSLENIAYTLLVGREQMEERLCFIVNSLVELRVALKKYLEGSQECYRSKPNTSSMEVLDDDDEEDMQIIYKKWFANGRLNKLAELWVNGMDIDWKKFYNQKLKLISLPKYPFDHKSFWISKDYIDIDNMHVDNKLACLHPLVHENISNFEGIKYSSTFVGTEKVLSDHIINGKMTLPAAAFLEMIVTAFVNAANISISKQLICMKDIVWIKPLTIENDPKSIKISLNGHQDELNFLITDFDDEKILYSSGEVITMPGRKTETINLTQLQSEVNSRIEAKELYEYFESLNMKYLSTQRGILYLLYSKEKAVAKIQIPSECKNDLKLYTLHPSILDSALQSAIGLSLGTETETRTKVPFLIKTCNVYKQCVDTMWSVAETNKKGHINITLYDEVGNICVELIDIYYKEIELEKKAISKNEDASVKNTTTNINVEEILYDDTVDWLKGIFSSVTKLDINEIDEEIYFENYGVDSILIMQINEKIEKSLGKISKTLLFEYQNIHTLASYFIEDYKEQLLEVEGIRTNNELIVQNEKSFQQDVQMSDRFETKETSTFNTKNRVANKLDLPEIAVIGMSGRYPKADNIDEYWNNIINGVDCITEIPKSRWDYTKYFNSDKNNPNTSYSKWGGFINDVYCFDPLFFGMMPKDALIMDPQERLFMQCAYSAIEDAGYTRQSLGYEPGSKVKRNVGVYVGVMNEEYHFYAIEEQTKGKSTVVSDNIAHVANRLSYFCDFHGPSITLDTMCSSSSVALHLAVQGIQYGECDMAIAGGTNLMLHPNKYFVLSAGKFASTNGKCMSFGEGGNGYVPSEGIGVVLLKNKEKAIADGDHIYGIIKSTSVNHDGKTNGYSVPNPQAQVEVIRQALDKANISAKEISYVEAHGTGTVLGDPIELNALDKVFKGDDSKGKSCAIGSVKSNIGHCESASGIAALTKVLLQMKYKKIAPSLHSTVTNKNIDFNLSTFNVNQDACDWNIDTNVCDRRIAGISSFGAGGTNSHIIVEEYISDDNSVNDIYEGKETIIVLSAKNKEQLVQMANNLHEKISIVDQNNLSSISYTLLVGRETFTERLAFVVTDIQGLLRKLNAFINDQETDDLFYGQVYYETKISKKMQKAMSEAIEIGDYKKVADLWSKGVSIDCELLFTEGLPKRKSLPTYPFSKEEYRIKTTSKSIQNFSNTPLQLEPLNISSVYNQRFSIGLSECDFYLTNHQINGKKVLPASVILELVRRSGKMSLEQSVFIMQDLVWLNRIDVSEIEQRMYIDFVSSKETLDFSVTVAAVKDDIQDEDKIYCEGRILCDTKSDYDISVETINIDNIKENLKSVILGDECYEYLKVAGVDNGVGLQCIREIQYNDNLAIAHLEINSGDCYDYQVLDPIIINGVFQSVAALLFKKKQSDNVALLPFTISEMRIYNKVEAECYACITKTNYILKDNQRIYNFDIVLVNTKGDILVEIDEFTIKSFREKEIDNNYCSELKYYGTKWTDAPVSEKPITCLDNSDVVLVFSNDVEVGEEIIEQLNKSKSGISLLVSESNTFEKRADNKYSIDITNRDHYLRLLTEVMNEYDKPNKIIIFRNKEDYERNKEKLIDVYSLYYLSQAMMKLKQRTEIKVEFVFTCDANQIYPEFEAVSSFSKSIKIENMYFNYKMIKVHIEKSDSIATIAKFIIDEFDDDQNNHEVMYLNHERYCNELIEIKDEEFNEDILVSDGKTFLITGGVGHLSSVFIEWLIEKAKVNIVLVGRRELNKDEQKKIARFKSSDSNVVYIRADISDENSVKDLYADIKKRFGSVNTIMHSAGVKKDSFVLKKEMDDVKKVFAPKIYGTKYLDQVFKDEKLDYFIVFSSIASIFGNIGQTDYSYANRYMDQFVKWRNQKHKEKLRYGKSISINWPLWEDGNMQMDHNTKENMQRQSGFVPLNEADGIESFSKILQSSVDEVIVLKSMKSY